MCLQWCHTNNQLIDNDLPCSHCALFGALRPDQRCDSCRHRVDRADKPPMCALTRMGLPLAGGCCHANVTPYAPDDGVILLRASEIAPGLMQRRRVTTVAALFDRSMSAPVYELGAGGRIQVRLDDLALPEVYGVPSPDWDDALGRARPAVVLAAPAEALASAPRHGDAVMPLLNEITAAVEDDAPNPTARAALLERARALLPLPEPWDGIVQEAIALLEEPTP